MDKVRDMISASRLGEILERRDSEKMKKVILGTLAIVGVIASIAGIAYAVHKYIAPKHKEDLDADFVDEFDEDYFE